MGSKLKSRRVGIDSLNFYSSVTPAHHDNQAQEPGREEGVL